MMHTLRLKWSIQCGFIYFSNQEDSVRFYYREKKNFLTIYAQLLETTKTNAVMHILIMYHILVFLINQWYNWKIVFLLII